MEKAEINFSKIKKIKSVRSHFQNLVTKLKSTDKGSFYKQVKFIGGIQPSGSGKLSIESLNGEIDEECAEEVAKAFASVSNEYQPVDRGQLPAYLPALPHPQVTQYEVHNKLIRLKNTRSTLSIDIPNMLRKEVALKLSEPLTHIINSCLNEQKFSALWKIETVCPVPKTNPCKEVTDVRKIACTPDYNKLYEAFLKDWIMEDISKNIHPKQFGGQKRIWY